MEKLTRSEKRLRRSYLQNEESAQQCQQWHVDGSVSAVEVDESLSLTIPDDFEAFSPIVGEASVSLEGSDHASVCASRVRLEESMDTLGDPEALFHVLEEASMSVEGKDYLSEGACSMGMDPPLDIRDNPDVSLPILDDSSISSEGRHPPSEDFPWFYWDAVDDDESSDPHQDSSYNPAACEDPLADFTEDEVHEDPTFSPTATPLFAGASITVFESVVAILSYVQSEHLSGVGFGRLLSLIALLLPKPNNFVESSHAFFKLLDEVEEPLNIHYFCSICCRARSSVTDLCDFCEDEARTVQYYISLPLLPQIRKLFERPGFIDDIKYKSKRVKQNNTNIEDIYDGEVYKEAQHGILSTDTNISLMYNTDGVQVFNSSSFSMWPFYLVVNELSPAKRHLSENMLIGGIWGSVCKPHPNIFLLPIYKELKTLQHGVDVQFHGSDLTHRVHVKLLCGTCDSPATALMLNIKTHSGFYSCHVCKIRGVTEQCSVFPYENNTPLRSVEEHNRNVAWAVEHKVLVNKQLLNEPECAGVKGPTILSYMLPNLFSCTAIDGMHCIYLGIMKQLLHLWFDCANRNEVFSIYTDISKVNKKMHALTPPHFLQRSPQPIDKLVYWKASECRSFLFNIGPFVLDEILKPEYYSHFLLLVEGVALINTSSVSHDDIHMSDMLLDRFVSEFQALYGLRNMSHNLHRCLHLGYLVKKLGPVWATTCFPFEDMNGRLLRLVHGTRHAGMQVYSNLSLITQLPQLVNSLQDSPAKKFCESLKFKWMQYKVAEKISSETYCIGDKLKLSETTSWVLNYLVISLLLPNLSGSSVLLFQRLYKEGLLYVSSSYKRCKRVSSHVQYLKNGTVQFGEVEIFVMVKSCSCPDTCSCVCKYYALIKPFRSTLAYQIEDISVSHIFLCNITDNESRDVVPVSDLLCVMFKLAIVGPFCYLSKPLNKYELE